MAFQDLLERYYNIDNPLIKATVTPNEVIIVPLKSSIKYIDTLSTIYDFQVDQGSITLQQLNDKINQGSIDIDYVLDLANQGKVILPTWVPNINQGNINIFDYIFSPNQGEIDINHLLPHIVYSTPDINEFFPRIRYSTPDIILPGRVNQGYIVLNQFDQEIDQGEINLPIWRGGLGNQGSVELGQPPLPDQLLIKPVPDSFLQFASFLDYLIDPGGLDFILLDSGAEVLPETAVPFNLFPKFLTRRFYYIGNKSLKAVDIINNSNVKILQDYKSSGGNQTWFINYDYESQFIDQFIKNQIDPNKKIDTLPGRSISFEVESTSFKDEKTAYKQDPRFGYSTLDYNKIIDKANNSTNLGDFHDFRDSISITPNNSLNLKPVKSYSENNFVKRLKTGDPGLNNLDRTNVLNDTGQTDALMKFVEATGLDLVTLKFLNIRDITTIQFRSFIKGGFTDEFSPKWNEVEYIGRPDTLDIYKGIIRTTSVTFIVPALTRQELPIMYAKLNELNNMVLPDKVGLMVAPFIKFTLGDYFVNIPAYITSLRYEILDEFPWEINIDDGKLGELPQYIQVTIGLKIVGNESPTAANQSFKFKKLNG